MSFKVKPRLAREAIIGNQSDRAAASITADGHSRSAVLAPKKDRHLVNSGRIVRIASGHYQIRYGSAKVPYARIHELGGMTGRNYATKIIAKHYLRDGGDSATRGDISKHWRAA